MSDKEKYILTENVASFKAGQTVEFAPNEVPLALQAHVIRASSTLTVNPANEELEKKVIDLESELEDLLRDKYESLYDKKAGGNMALDTLRSKVKDKEAE